MNSTSRRHPISMKPCPELDFTSESFDPVKALSTRNIRLLFPRAKTYNNLAEYYSHTFLKKNNLERKEKVIPQERNYPWYIRTLGLWGRRAQRFEENLKSRRDRNRRVGKKPIKITYLPGSPLRSEKVIKLKSSFKGYWKRKCLLYKRGIERAESRNLFQKIKWLAKPLTASDLILKAVQNCTARTNISEVKEAGTGSCQTINSSHVDNEKSAEGSNSKSKDVGGSNSVIECNGGIKRSCKVRNGKSDKHFLAVENKNCYDSVNKGMIKADHSNLSPLENGTDGVTARNLGQDHPNNVLASKENTFKTKQNNSKSKNGIKLVEKKSRTKLPKVKRLKSKKFPKITIKENVCVPIARCTCFPNVSCELSCQCTCGFYSTAMKNLQKFKIPKKKSVN